MSKTTLSLKIGEEKKDDLENEADDQDLSLSEYVRQILDERRHRSAILEEMKEQERRHTEELERVRQDTYETVMGDVDDLREQKDRQIANLEERLQQKNDEIEQLENRVVTLRKENTRIEAKTIMKQYEELWEKARKRGYREAGDRVEELERKLETCEGELEIFKEEVGASYLDQIKNVSLRAEDAAREPPSIFQILRATGSDILKAVPGFSSRRGP